MKTIVRRIGLVAHDAMKKDMIEWVLWNSERLIGHKFYCTGTTGTLIKKALEEKHPEIKWDITILKSGPLGGCFSDFTWNILCIIGSEIHYCKKDSFNHQSSVQSSLYHRNGLNQLLKTFNWQICSLNREQHRICSYQRIDRQCSKRWHAVDQNIIVSFSLSFFLFPEVLRFLLSSVLCCNTLESIYTPENS